MDATGAAPAPTLAIPLSESAKRGKSVYLMCVACHQPTGEGVLGAFPALAGSPRVLGAEDVLIKIVLKGLQGPIESQGRRYNGVMPGHEAAFTDRQIADVLSYVRTSWGNTAGEISEVAVRNIRANISDRRAPWSAQDLLP
jgi:mono/diheme cytochrome c family protein